MPESESPQDPQAHFHKKIPSIFGKLLGAKPTASPGEASASPCPAPEPANPTTTLRVPPKLINPTHLLLGALVGLIAVAGGSTSAFFALKFRSVDQRLKDSEKTVASYQQAMLQLQKEVQGKTEFVTDLGRLKRELEDASQLAQQSKTERETLSKAIEEVSKKEQAARAELDGLHQQLQDSEKAKGRLQDQVAQVTAERSQLQGKLTGLEGVSPNQSVRTDTKPAVKKQAQLVVVKPAVKIGVINRGARDGIAPDMVLGIFDDHDRKLGTFRVDEVEEFFAAGRIWTDQIAAMKPGMRVSSEE